MKKLLLAIFVVPVLMQFAIAQNAENTAKSGFSFDVYGDSRSMMYLPYKAAQEAEARKLMVDMFDLVFPEKISAEVVQKDVKLIYDPSNHELLQMVMPFDTRSEVTTLTFDKGMGHFGLSRGCEAVTRGAPHHVPVGRWPMGRA